MRVIEELLAQARAELEAAPAEEERAKLEAEIKLLEEWQARLKGMRAVEGEG
jgi:hypothetical protein